jgi:hypothetical protein
MPISEEMVSSRLLFGFVAAWCGVLCWCFCAGQSRRCLAIARSLAHTSRLQDSPALFCL